MGAMASNCTDCGGAADHVRARFEIHFRDGRLVADEVPAVRCQACERTVPAEHVRPQLNAVIELAQEVPGATARKNFADVPLRPDKSGS